MRDPVGATLLINLNGDDEASVIALDSDYRYLAGSAPAPVEFPLTNTDLEDLRWYLEDYPQSSYGAHHDRAETISTATATWGRRLFDCVLSGRDALNAYHAARRSSSETSMEVVVQSADPAWLGLPWEIMQDPARTMPLSAEGVEFRRSIGGATPVGDREVVLRRLRVLMVIARPGTPAGTDVSYTGVARPIVDKLERLAGTVDFTVLRPPTEHMLDTVLGAARAQGDPFHVVHFDGHGVSEGGGSLIFEAAQPAAGSDAVAATEFARIIARHGVEVVVLNACRSAAMSKTTETAVATAIAGNGGASVVAMAYKVIDAAASTFMSGFYDSVFEGHSLSRATNDGRARVRASPIRAAVGGDELPLQDWMVPVLYGDRTTRFRGLARGPDESPTRVPFVGRDSLFLELEKLADTSKVIVLHGHIGVGKSALAREFGRWRQLTGGLDRVDAVLMASAELLGRAERRAEITEMMRTRRMMLIVDDLDVSAATGALWAYLGQLARGRSTVVVTTRNGGGVADSGLGVARVQVDGLAREDSVALATHLLRSVPSRLSEPAMAQLLDWCGGNPSLMGEVLPYLTDRSSAEVLEHLQQAVADPAGKGAEPAGSVGRSPSVCSAVAGLGADERRMLFVLSVFHGSVDIDDVVALVAKLEELVDNPRNPMFFRPVPAARWFELFGRLYDAGLVSTPKVGEASARYTIHGALPSVLATLWYEDDPEVFSIAYNVTVHMLAIVHAEMADRWESEHRRELSTSPVVRSHVDAFGRSLDHVLEHEEWDRAHQIVRCLNGYFEQLGRPDEAERWVDRVRRVLGSEQPPVSTDDAAAELSLFVESATANRLIAVGNAGAANRIYDSLERQLRRSGDYGRWQPIFDFQRGYSAYQAGAFAEATTLLTAVVTAAPGSVDPRTVAEAWHNLGNCAIEQGKLKAAAQRFREAQRLFRLHGHLAELEITAYQLCNTLVDLGRIDEAEDEYERLEQACEEKSDIAAHARVLHQRAYLQCSVKEYGYAIELLRKSLQLKQQTKAEERSIAQSYMLLGSCHLKLGTSEGAAESVEWSTSALEICERNGDRLRAADCCNNLGAAAFLSDNPELAKKWWGKQREIENMIGDPTRLASIHLQLSVVASDRTESLTLLIMGASILAAMPHESHRVKEQWDHTLNFLAVSTHSLRPRQLDNAWRAATGKRLPEEIRTEIIRRRNEIR
ncbi:CHAT domain-containing protein [Nocardia sp. NPDC058705]|uniref:CHAT domain-containing protein n=1 Tax=Nocardia sp. NPDC058705 TaxID=3346609 RepID=UPI0036C3F2F5